MSETTFQSLFRTKEFSTLSGRRKRNIVVLSIVTLFTFISVGFALGTLEYLGNKLNDPFVRQLSFQVSQKITGVPNSEAVQTVQSWSNKYNFNPKNVSLFGPTWNQFYAADGKYKRKMRGRGMSQSNPVLKDLVSNKNIVWASPGTDLQAQMDGYNIRIIVTADFMESHGFDPNDPPSFLKIHRPGSESWQIPLLAVVKRLPDRASYVLTNDAWLSLEGAENTISRQPGNTLYLYFPQTEAKSQEDILSETTKEISLTRIKPQSVGWIESKYVTAASMWTPRNEDLIEIKLNRSDTSNFELARRLQDYLNKSSALAMFEWGSATGVQLVGQNNKYEIMTVYLDDLEQVNPFTEELINTYDRVEVDLSSIENKESLRLFSGLAYIMAIFLISFSILSITTFVNSLIGSHFQRIQRNLGTLKAFGLSKKILMRAYARISLTFVLISATVGYLVAFAIGYVGTMRVLISLANLPLAPKIPYFNLFNWESGVTFLVIVSTSYLFVRLNLSKLLQYTPGELIYDRV